MDAKVLMAITLCSRTILDNNNQTSVPVFFSKNGKISGFILEGYIEFKHNSIIRAYNTGFGEYPNVEWVWEKHNLSPRHQRKGWPGIYSLVLHECSHPIARSLGEIDGHSPIFQRVLSDLIKRYTYSMFVDIVNSAY